MKRLLLSVLISACQTVPPVPSDTDAKDANTSIAASAQNVTTEAKKEAPVKAATRIRPAAVAGSWYPGTFDALSTEVDRLFEKAKTLSKMPPMKAQAIVAPHAGYRYSGATAALSVSQIDASKVNRVILLAPSHRARFDGISIMNVDAYETPLGQIMLDPVVDEIRKSELVHAYDRAHVSEHAIEIELPLLQKHLSSGFTLVPMLVGSMTLNEYKQAAELIKPYLDERTVLFVSSDFTHFGSNYGYLPFAVDAHTKQNLHDLDFGFAEFLKTRDAQGLAHYRAKTGITACGFSPLMMMLYALGQGPEPSILHYTTSAAETGDADYGMSVSYFSIAYPRTVEPKATKTLENPKMAVDDAVQSFSEADLKALHKVAKEALRLAVTEGPKAIDKAKDLPWPEAAKNPSGAFVTLKKQGDLRGCIGYIEPHGALIDAIVQNAMNAALKDPRFMPVTADELDQLSVEISVLSPLKASSLDAIVLGRDGILLTKNHRRAVFLPEVPIEQGWNLETTLNHLARKAGLPMDAWREGAQFETFTSQIFEAPYAP